MANANPGYFGFMNNRAGLGRVGTHVAHSVAAGGITYAAGKYGGIEVISANWWAPFVGAIAGLGLSLAAEYMLVTPDVRVAILAQKIEMDLAGRSLTDHQSAQLNQTLTKMRLIEAQQPPENKGSETSPERGKVVNS